MENNQMKKKAEVELQQYKFNSIVLIAKQFTDDNRYYEACIVAEIAAYFAATNHPGVFSSPLLEKILLEIGNKCIKRSNRRKLEDTTSIPKHILHVITEAHSIGGSTRGVWRWIQLDDSRTHSVAVTQQRNYSIPPELKQAALSSRGAFYVLDADETNIIAIAKHLWEISIDIDLVILHTHSRDIIPILAFSDTDASPRIAKLDIADHLFWLDASISNSIFHMRSIAFDIAEKRRGVPPIHSTLLPIPLVPIHGALSKEQAKNQVGLSSEDIVLLTIASDYKYLTESISFLDALVPIILRFPQLNLIAIGPTRSSDWVNAFERTGGRIQALGSRSDTALFYQAADVYLDSFPFSSNTSILEAGLYGLPAVSFNPNKNHNRVLGPGCPGLTKVLLESSSINVYQKTIERLVRNKKLRHRIGLSTKKRIELFHTGKGWLSILNSAYSHSFNTSRLKLCELNQNTENIIDDFDMAVSFLLKKNCLLDLKLIIELSSIRSIGIISKFSILIKLRKVVDKIPLSVILPRKIENIISRIWRSIRKFHPPIIIKDT